MFRQKRFWDFMLTMWWYVLVGHYMGAQYMSKCSHFLISSPNKGCWINKTGCFLFFMSPIKRIGFLMPLNMMDRHKNCKDPVLLSQDILKRKYETKNFFFFNTLSDLRLNFWRLGSALQYLFASLKEGMSGYISQ